MSRYRKGNQCSECGKVYIKKCPDICWKCGNILYKTEQSGIFGIRKRGNVREVIAKRTLFGWKIRKESRE